MLTLLRPLTAIARFALSLLALWIFADIGLLSYFNSFYSDVPAVLGGLATALLAVNLLAARSWPATWTRAERGDAADRWARRLGYVLVGVLLWLFAATWYARQLQEQRARLTAVEAPELVDLARELEQGKWQRHTGRIAA